MECGTRAHCVVSLLFDNPGRRSCDRFRIYCTVSNGSENGQANSIACLVFTPEAEIDGSGLRFDHDWREQYLLALWRKSSVG